MKCASDAFYNRFMDYLYSNGLTPIEHAMPQEPLEIYRNREYICSFLPNGEIYSKYDTEECNQIRAFVDKYYALYIQCEYLLDMPFEDVRDYKKIHEIGDTILAGRIMSDNRLEFVVWEFDYDRKGVHSGKYFKDDITAAKQCFILRSGLLDKRQLFSNQELSDLKNACLYRAVNDKEITFEEEQSLHSVMEHIEEIMPSPEVSEAANCLQAESYESEELDL